MPEHAGAERIPGLDREQLEGGARLVWSNWQIPKSRGLMLAYGAGMLLSGALAIFLSYGLFRDLVRTGQGAPAGTGVLLVSGAFAMAGWAIALASAWTLLRLRWTESVTVSAEGVQLAYTGPLAPKPRLIPSQAIWRISYEKIQTRGDRETRFSVNIFYQDGRESLAFWMRSQEKRQLYTLLKEAVTSQGWPYVDFQLSERPGQEQRRDILSS